ncbi:MAG: apolipoprotein N-acyltransferase [Bacteroidales bacterium]|nr:apolipoprotein N-acyltransferase [Bacteroidales bacterium]
MRNKLLLWIFVLLFAVLMSIPWLVPRMGVLALVGFLPLLLADDIATQLKMKHFWVYSYVAFVLWNAFTTFWVCNATVGGGIFAVLANALQMCLIWGVFRFSKKRLGGVLPYLFLAAMWIAWERFYFSADISWPWLVLGNAFARSTRLVQWYSVTGTLGGSLWIWAANLGIYGILVALSDGHAFRWNFFARITACLALILVFFGPIVASRMMYNRYSPVSEGTVDVVIGQPNFDPYHKFESMSQAEQDSVLICLYDSALENRHDGSVLLLAPETFTSSMFLDRIPENVTMKDFQALLQKNRNAEILFGASTYEYHDTRSAPLLSYPYGDGWLRSYNSAVLADADGNTQVYHKSRLVVGTEKTPYPKLFVPLDNWLCKVFKMRGPLIARCVGQDAPSVLRLKDSTALGCAVCYESVYPEFCTGYVKAGARAMTVITNDAWWGNTPGYRQHLSYSRLRAIELRRDIARCGNTGISCFIDQRGDIVQQGPWWEECTLQGKVNLNSAQTPFVRYGDIVGRVCTLAFLLLLALLIVRLFLPRSASR